MKTWSRLRLWVKMVILVLIASVVGLTCAFIYQANQTSHTEIHSFSRPSEIADFLKATEGQL